MITYIIRAWIAQAMCPCQDGDSLDFQQRSLKERQWCLSPMRISVVHFILNLFMFMQMDFYILIAQTPSFRNQKTWFQSSFWFSTACAHTAREAEIIQESPCFGHTRMWDLTHLQDDHASITRCSLVISLNSEHAVLAAMHLQTRTHFEGDPSLLLPLISAAFAWSFERPCRFLAIHPCGVRATGSAASFKDGDGVLSQPDMPG